MLPFIEVAKPNPDVVDGTTNLESYAADLYAVAIGGGGARVRGS